VCDACSDATRCLSCSNGRFLYASECLNQCPPKYYARNRVCLPCSDRCKSCSDYESRCTGGCETPYVLQNLECLSECIPGFVADNGVCIGCPKGCLKCVFHGNQLDCLRCKDDWFLLDSRCLAQCPVGLFGRKTTQTCEPCAEACGTCFGPSDNECLSCNTAAGYRHLTETACAIPTCADGTYYSDRNRLCEGKPLRTR
jgi:hypothetical protein